MLSLLLTLLFASPLTRADEGHFHELPSGGRMSLHGMVLYGANGSYFLDHIPMESAPHDFQIIAEVRLQKTGGEALREDFSGETFTLKPKSNFSLNDYVAGRLTHFSGEIYRGGFEQGGLVIRGLENINVEVVALRKARQIPAAAEGESFELSDGINRYRVNMITPARNTQQITNETKGRLLWCARGPDFFEFCP